MFSLKCKFTSNSQSSWDVGSAMAEDNIAVLLRETTWNTASFSRSILFALANCEPMKTSSFPKGPESPIQVAKIGALLNCWNFTIGSCSIENNKIIKQILIVKETK